MKRNEFLKSIIGLPFLVSAIGEQKGNVIPSYARNQTIIVTPDSKLSDPSFVDWENCEVLYSGKFKMKAMITHQFPYGEKRKTFIGDFEMSSIENFNMKHCNLKSLNSNTKFGINHVPSGCPNFYGSGNTIINASLEQL